MKKVILVTLFLLFNLSYVKGDIIFYPQIAFNESGIRYSIELINSYEIPILKNNSFLTWGGIGIVGRTKYLEITPAQGIEFGFEIRHYFGKKYLNGFCISLYSGAAYMFANNQISDQYISKEYDSFLGLVNGFKLTYRGKIVEKLYIEPYISLSYPIYKGISNSYNYEYRYNHFKEKGLLKPEVTFGIRLCLNFIHNKKK